MNQHGPGKQGSRAESEEGSEDVEESAGGRMEVRPWDKEGQKRNQRVRPGVPKSPAFPS